MVVLKACPFAENFIEDLYCPTASERESFLCERQDDQFFGLKVGNARRWIWCIHVGVLGQEASQQASASVTVN